MCVWVCNRRIWGCVHVCAHLSSLPRILSQLFKVTRQWVCGYIQLVCPFLYITCIRMFLITSVKSINMYYQVFFVCVVVQVWSVWGWIQKWGQACEQERGGRRESESRECFSESVRVWWQSEEKTLKPRISPGASHWDQSFSLLLIWSAANREKKDQRCWEDTVSLEHHLSQTLKYTVLRWGLLVNCVRLVSRHFYVQLYAQGHLLQLQVSVFFKKIHILNTYLGVYV